MFKRNKSLFLKFLSGLVLLTGVSSCQLFENDVADFMEKYTETAAIETHEFNVETYDDAQSRLCISSEADTVISLYMRNPKQFNLIPSVTFPQLGSGISRATVNINQTDKQTILLSLPQSFLVPADEGNDITAEISLHEPMSGREFDHYKVNLSCNTIPPQIQNPTIYNDGTNHYVLAFDMPNEEEVALRHTDISEIVINGTSYPVSIPEPVEDTSSDMEGVMIVEYAASTLPDSHFVKSTGSTCPYTIIEKTFTPTNNSFYFLSNEPLIAGDKQYTVELKDSAGLTSSILASTRISKLNKPVVKAIDQTSGTATELTGEGILAVPYNEETEKGIITITPPTADHRGNAVSGSTVHYRIYEATGTGRLYTSGTTTTTKTIELPQNTYRVEAYATRTNYEQSSTESLKIRLMNNVIYIEAVTDPTSPNLQTGEGGADGSVNAPFPTIQDAIADINALPDDQRRNSYTFYVKGDFTGDTLSQSNPTTAANYGQMLLNSIKTADLTIAKWPGANVAKLKTIEVTSSDTDLRRVKIGDITLTNNGSHLSFQNPFAYYEVDGTVIQGTNNSSATGIYLYYTADSRNIIKNCTISGCNLGVWFGNAAKGTLQNVTISSCNTGVSYNSNKISFINGASIDGTPAGTDPTKGIEITDGTLTINDVQITGADIGINAQYSPTINLYGGSITGNQIGIEMSSGATLHVKGAPVVNNNQTSDATPAKQNIMIPNGGQRIAVDGALTSGCRLSVTTYGAPTAVGDPLQEFTSGFRANNATAMPSSFFLSDEGLSVVLSSNGQAGLVVAGASGEDMYSASDYNFTFAVTDADGISNEAVYPGMTKTLKITPTITRPGTASPVTLHYNSADRKLYTTPTFDTGTVCAGGSTVTWTAELYGSGRKLSDIPASNITAVEGERAINVKVSIPENPGSYILKVYANFLGLPRSVSCPMTSATKAINAAAAIASYTSGNHNVTVTDPVSPADLMAVADALRTHTSDNVGINLDASGTVNANSNLDDYAAYDSGAYFLDCTALKSMKLPVWMEGILPGLFRNSGITYVEIPDSVDLISAHAFYGCTGLTTITIPAAVTEIGASAFNGCTELATINFAGTKNQWGRITRTTGWHAGIAATQVHCSDGYCDLDYVYTVSFIGTAYSESGDGTVLFGDWPQTVLPSSSSVTVDESISVTQGTFTYYYGSDGNWYAKMAENANGLEEQYKYSDGTQPVQNGSVYRYFKVEPIEWKILTTDYNGTGKKLLLAKKCLVPFRFDDDSNNYANSDIRTYLNDGFYNSAFTTELQARIADTTVINNARSTNPDLHATQWNSGNNSNASDTPTTDKLFLLSEQEVTKSEYGFTGYDVYGAGNSRIRFPTDFAKAAGAFQGSLDGEGNLWWLRSPYYNASNKVYAVESNGAAGFVPNVTDGTYGLVPALCLTE